MQITRRREETQTRCFSLRLHEVSLPPTPQPVHVYPFPYSPLLYHFQLIVLQTIILWVMHYIPSLRLRVSEETEALGIDESDMGELAYDYIGGLPEAESIHPLITSNQRQSAATAMNMDTHSGTHYMKERRSQATSGS